MSDFSTTWVDLLRDVLTSGVEVAPRGLATKELPQHTIQVDMMRPVLMVPGRKLNYQFMAAEAYWILTGDNRVATIAPYNKRIADFSDDGVTFYGAYGPKVLGQLQYVVSTLLKDRSTRQAGLTIWRENPKATRDVPCTVAIFFGLRQGKLNVHVFMRSSDIWLGIPYDVFNFAMLGHFVCAWFNQDPTATLSPIEPGQLYLTAASSHLYQTNWEAAMACLEEKAAKEQQPVPPYWTQDPYLLLERLSYLRASRPGDATRWWEAL